jgi:hypothetical protein
MAHGGCLARQVNGRPTVASKACKIAGYSRASVYRFKDLYDKGSELALEGINHEADSEQAHRAEDCSETGEQPHARQIEGKLIWAIYDRGRKRINVASKLPRAAWSL